MSRSAPSSAAGSYRIQVAATGGFAGVQALTTYLRDLGVSTLYLSPVFQSRSGSGHGYDVVDPGRIDAGLGGLEGLERLGSACRASRMSLILDIVPNHMALSHENGRWWSVLEDGPASGYGAFFDVDWDQHEPPTRGKVILPILGRRYHRVLEAGELEVVRGPSGYLLRYYDHVLPLDVSAHPVLSRPGGTSDEEAEAAVASLNRAGTDPEGRAALDRMLVAQPYWLVHWRTAPEEVNYRRFFDIAHLVALRMERSEVFRDWHAFLAELLERLPIGGLRVDHVDGLADPEGYLARLRELVERAGRGEGEVALLVEKILAPEESLPESWEADGTTGYDFIAAADGVLVGADGAARLRERYRSFTGSAAEFHEEARRNKRKAIRMHFRRDLERLVDLALPLVHGHVWGRDLARSEVEAALTEVTVQLRGYRTYVNGPPATAREVAPMREAVDRARRRRRDLPAGAFAVLRSLFALEAGGSANVELVERWQQLTSAVMAKGLEDTTFYTYNVLTSSNEVGADPGVPARGVSAFHDVLAFRGGRWPRTLNTTSTHDTKRSEDMRARIHVLAELADEWGERVEQWHAWNDDLRERVGRRLVPTPNEEWFLYQTLIGVWPFEGGVTPELEERLATFLRKAAREAKVHTDWYDPRPRHEEALIGFMRRILDPGRDHPFLDDFVEFQTRTAFHGALNSLSRLLVKLAAPGVPDFFQGEELWRLRMVDPDNRGPVDWERRRALLEELRSRTSGSGEPDRVADEHLREMLDGWTDGRVKLLLTWRGLRFRGLHDTLFRDGGYRPVNVSGHAADHVIAFLRHLGGAWVLAVAPRLPAGLTAPGRFPLGEEIWRDTTLELPEDAPRAWRDAITGRAVAMPESEGHLPLARALSRFPVALLHGRSDEASSRSAANASRNRRTASGSDKE
ncbi:MAG: malto-oligosyltrehalose synthase [Gemmatimonadota bacterium]|nr:malto-oligosyltrehalose synthase [Gemmatimonadota bacterium]